MFRQTQNIIYLWIVTHPVTILNIQIFNKVTRL